VIELRRTRVGPFSVEAAIPLDRLPDDADLMARAILPLQAGLGEIPIVPVDRSAAATLRRGQKLLLRGQAPTQGRAYVECFGTPIAFGVVEDGYFVSTRVFNLRG
jgi:tRNA pseudouridine55 synthase